MCMNNQIISTAHNVNKEEYFTLTDTSVQCDHAVAPVFFLVDNFFNPTKRLNLISGPQNESILLALWCLSFFKSRQYTFLEHHRCVLIEA